MGRSWVKEATRGKEVEAEFRTHFIAAGFTVANGREIHCLEPVKDHRGRKVKTSTLPDYLIIDSKGRQYHVEVASGKSVSTSSKQAQLRVIQAAGVQNYIQLSESHLKQLRNLRDPVKKRELINSWFSWT